MNHPTRLVFRGHIKVTTQGILNLSNHVNVIKLMYVYASENIPL